jgi:hypothetical protein
MWAWIHKPDAVIRAAAIHQVDRLSWWRRRTDLPRKEPDRSEPTLHALGQRLSELLMTEEGRGRFCSVEVLERRGSVCYLAYPDDFVQNFSEHDAEGQLAVRTYRPTFTVAFAFTPSDGSLELCAKVPLRLRPRVESIFAETVLGIELPDWNPTSAYNLNRLKEPSFVLVTDPADNLIVHVRHIRLSLKNSKRRIGLDADPDRQEDVFRMLVECLNREHVPLAAVNVTKATFCFEFPPVDGRRAGSATFDVIYPSNCNLRHQPAWRVELITKYLRRWGIHASQPTDPDYRKAG